MSNTGDQTNPTGTNPGDQVDKIGAQIDELLAQIPNPDQADVTPTAPAETATTTATPEAAEAPATAASIAAVEPTAPAVPQTRVEATTTAQTAPVTDAGNTAAAPANTIVEQKPLHPSVNDEAWKVGNLMSGWAKTTLKQPPEMDEGDLKIIQSTLSDANVRLEKIADRIRHLDVQREDADVKFELTSGAASSAAYREGKETLTQMESLRILESQVAALIGSCHQYIAPLCEKLGLPIPQETQDALRPPPLPVETTPPPLPTAAAANITSPVGSNTIFTSTTTTLSEGSQFISSTSAPQATTPTTPVAPAAAAAAATAAASTAAAVGATPAAAATTTPAAPAAAAAATPVAPTRPSSTMGALGTLTTLGVTAAVVGVGGYYALPLAVGALKSVGLTSASSTLGSKSAAWVATYAAVGTFTGILGALGINKVFNKIGGLIKRAFHFITGRNRPAYAPAAPATA